MIEGYHETSLQTLSTTTTTNVRVLIFDKNQNDDTEITTILTNRDGTRITMEDNSPTYYSGTGVGLVLLIENVLSVCESEQYLLEYTITLPWVTEHDNFGIQSRETCYFAQRQDCIFSYVGLRLVPTRIVDNRVSNDNDDLGGDEGYEGCIENDTSTHDTTNFAQQEQLEDTINQTMVDGDNNSNDDDDYWPDTLRKIKCRVEVACKEAVGAIAAGGTLDWTATSSSSTSPSPTTGLAVNAKNDHVLTACLANRYPPGSGYIPWHYDEVRAHGQLCAVASLSLGGPRRFQLRRRKDRSPHVPTNDDNKHDNDNDSKKTNGSHNNNSTNNNTKSSKKNEEEGGVVVDIMLPPGSVLLMTGNIQEHYEHRLPLSSSSSSLSTPGVKTRKDGKDSDNYDIGYDDPHRISLTFRSIVPGFEDRLDIGVAQDGCCTQITTMG
jgi:hypothetical protein